MAAVKLLMGYSANEGSILLDDATPNVASVRGKGRE